MSKVMAALKETTLTLSIHLLTPEILLVQYAVSGRKSSALDLCSTSGEYLLKHEIFFRMKIFAAKSGRIYSIEQPKQQDFDEISNPVINVFEFIPGGLK